MSSVALYRELVPDHAEDLEPDVTDPVITRWLSLGARLHPAEPWGDVYPEAMVWWAAHRIQRLPGMVTGGGGASDTGQVVQQKDVHLQRQWMPQVAARGTDAELGTTRYGELYLELRDSLAITVGRVVG